MSERINARLSRPLAEFVDRMVGEAGLYETPSEYVRDLIRRDMERRDGQFVQDAILAGYRDLAAGRVFASSGDLRRIYARSRREWGEDVADRYLADLYATMVDAAANPHARCIVIQFSDDTGSAPY